MGPGANVKKNILITENASKYARVLVNDKFIRASLVEFLGVASVANHSGTTVGAKFYVGVQPYSQNSTERS